MAGEADAALWRQRNIRWRRSHRVCGHTALSLFEFPTLQCFYSRDYVVHTRNGNECRRGSADFCCVFVSAEGRIADGDNLSEHSAASRGAYANYSLRNGPGMAARRCSFAGDRGQRLHSQLCPTLRPSCTADSGRSQAAALAADDWAQSGAREFKAEVRLM
jgi:hypothetical protein